MLKDIIYFEIEHKKDKCIVKTSIISFKQDYYASSLKQPCET